ncbi:RHS repeat-associated core domain-containing protein, partial [Hymenobacter terrestris]
FTDGATSGSQSPDYSYDAAGSLTADANKGIRLIRYNHLQLPERLEWANGNVLEYTYSAAGQKVSKLATEAGKPTAVRTDYVGPWQYERDSLRWLTHAEGRALYLYPRDPAGQVSTKVNYEYTLKDHLGNLRVAFHPGERKTYHAFLEPNENELRREQHEFDSVSVSAPIRRVDPTHQLAKSGAGFALLNAGGVAPQPLGPLKQLTVARGDTVDVVAYGMYQQPAQANWSFTLASFVASLLQPAVGAPAPPDGGRRVRVLPLLSVGLGLVPAVEQLSGGVPKAYLRVLVYNADSVLVAWPTKQLTNAANASVVDGGYEQLSLRVFVPSAGYVQAYVANESDTDVFFDDISVEHRQGLQVQENQYDPYGLDLVGLNRSATPQNKYSWNGKERQDEFGLNWLDHGWRFYDPTLGRWVVTDPDGEKAGQASWGSYQFGMDNAVRYNDLDGRCPTCPQGKAADEVYALGATIESEGKTWIYTGGGVYAETVGSKIMGAVERFSQEGGDNGTNNEVYDGSKLKGAMSSLLKKFLFANSIMGNGDEQEVGVVIESAEPNGTSPGGNTAKKEIKIDQEGLNVLLDASGAVINRKGHTYREAVNANQGREISDVTGAGNDAADAAKEARAEARNPSGRDTIQRSVGLFGRGSHYKILTDSGTVDVYSNDKLKK